MVKLGEQLIHDKFDDIDVKVDFLIAHCQKLTDENHRLNAQVKSMEARLKKGEDVEASFADQKAMIQSKMDGLLSKLEGFSNTVSTTGG